MNWVVSAVRDEFADLLYDGKFVVDKSGVKTLEIIGMSFMADDDHIFGEKNDDYIARELEWYKSQSLFVKDIPGKTPAIWEKVADRDGRINSNYGYLIWSFDNFSQYANVLEELKANPNSRRATMIYTRPSMHYDHHRNGMSDFVCTNAVNYLLRDGVVSAVVQMRSNDAVFGYRNDYAWQRYVLEKLASDLSVEAGSIVWNAASLHMYERHFYLVTNYILTGETTVKKEDFLAKYPDYPYK